MPTRLPGAPAVRLAQALPQLYPRNDGREMPDALDWEERGIGDPRQLVGKADRHQGKHTDMERPRGHRPRGAAFWFVNATGAPSSTASVAQAAGTSSQAWLRTAPAIGEDVAPRAALRTLSNAIWLRRISPVTHPAPPSRSFVTPATTYVVTVTTLMSRATSA